MNSFASLDAFLKGGRNPDLRRVPSVRSTVVHRLDESAIAVRYHDTDVVTHYRDGCVRLDSGGWRTATTKVRFNEYLPSAYSVYQDKGEWYLHLRRGNESIPYQDDITIHPDGTVTGAPKAWELRERQAWAKRINEYAKDYAQALVDGAVSAPSQGDCWYCLFTTQDGDSWTEATGDRTHLESHIRERYYVPSLLNRAYETHRYLSDFVRGCIGGLWWDEPRELSDWEKNITQEQVYKLLRKYLRHRFDLAG